MSHTKLKSFFSVFVYLLHFAELFALNPYHITKKRIYIKELCIKLNGHKNNEISHGITLNQNQNKNKDLSFGKDEKKVCVLLNSAQIHVNGIHTCRAQRFQLNNNSIRLTVIFIFHFLIFFIMLNCMQITIQFWW